MTLGWGSQLAAGAGRALKGTVNLGYSDIVLQRANIVINKVSAWPESWQGPF